MHAKKKSSGGVGSGAIAFRFSGVGSHAAQFGTQPAPSAALTKCISTSEESACFQNTFSAPSNAVEVLVPLNTVSLEAHNAQGCAAQSFGGCSVARLCLTRNIRNRLQNKRDGHTAEVSVANT